MIGFRWIIVRFVVISVFIDGYAGDRLAVDTAETGEPQFFVPARILETFQRFEEWKKYIIPHSLSFSKQNLINKYKHESINTQ